VIWVNRILQGSALQRLGDLDNDFVDCCITSPLYWSAVAKSKTEPQTWGATEDYDEWKGELGLEPKIEMYVAHLMMVFDEVKRVMKPEGSCSVVIGDTYLNKCLGLVPERFAIAMVNHGWILRSKLIWRKPNIFRSPSYRDRFNLDWEMIYWFTKSKQYYFNREWNMINVDTLNSKSSILDIPADARTKNFKFQSFPRNLIRILMSKTCPKDGLVLDPFMGSGTTAVVAIEMGRRYLGVEVSKDFIDIAIQRIRNEKVLYHRS
jgi:DNA modification methylase